MKKRWIVLAAIEVLCLTGCDGTGGVGGPGVSPPDVLLMIRRQDVKRARAGEGPGLPRPDMRRSALEPARNSR